MTFHHATQPGEPPNFRIWQLCLPARLERKFSASLSFKDCELLLLRCAEYDYIEVKDYWCHQTRFSMVFLNLRKWWTSRSSLGRKKTPQRVKTSWPISMFYCTDWLLGQKTCNDCDPMHNYSWWFQEEYAQIKLRSFPLGENRKKSLTISRVIQWRLMKGMLDHYHLHIMSSVNDMLGVAPSQ